MAKGDSNKAQNQINYQGGLAQNTLNNQRDRTNQLYGGMYNNWMSGMGRNLADYDSIMNNWQNFNNQASQFNLNPGDRANVDDAINRYKGFADTGGFSPKDIQDIRARAISPTRAVYANAQRDLSRANTLAGGNLANTTAGQAKLAREQSQAASDANVNANASIAQAIQQGKLAGIQGLGATSLAEQNAQMQADQIRNQLGLAGNQGMASLYSATPGLASTFGNQVLNANNQQNELQQLQNQLGLGLINSQINKSQVPGDFQQGLGNIGGILGLGGQLGGMLSGFGGWSNLLKNVGRFGGGGFGSQPGNTWEE